MPRAESVVVVSAEPGRLPQSNRKPTEHNVRISNGGCLELLEYLTSEYVKKRADTTFYLQRNITPCSLNLLECGGTDIAFTFEREQEQSLLDRKIAVSLGKVFDIGFFLVGPKKSTLSIRSEDPAEAVFQTLSRAVLEGKATFVSRGYVSPDYYSARVDACLFR